MKSKKTLFLSIFIVVAALISSGCIPGGLLSGAPVIESISDQIGKVGQEFIYQVIAYCPDNGELTYSLTEKPEGMQIEISNGLITWTPGENQIGTFTVEVKVNKGTSFALEQFEITVFEITVNDIILDFITVFPTSLSIYVEDSYTINSITAFYNDGSSVSIELSLVNYQSSNTNIAIVSSNGVISGVAAGAATITVSYTEGGITKTATIVVTVTEAPKVLTSITVLPSTMSIVVGNYKNITSITAHYDDESNTTIGLDSVSYSSNHTNIASVNTTGRVTGVSAGSATITVSYAEGGITKTADIGVTVSEAPKVLTSISVLPSTMSIYIGDSTNITSITAYYSDGSSKSIGMDSANYSSSSSNIATVSITGKVTGVAEGTAIITVGYIEGGVTKSDTVSVTVNRHG